MLERSLCCGLCRCAGTASFVVWVALLTLLVLSFTLSGQPDPFDVEYVPTSTDSAKQDESQGFAFPARNSATPHFLLVINEDPRTEQLLIEVVAEKGPLISSRQFTGTDLLIVLSRAPLLAAPNAHVLPLPDSFLVMVVFERDTARYDIVRKSGMLHITHRKKAPFLSLYEFPELSPNHRWYMLSSDQADLIAELARKLKPLAEVLTVPGGYYRHIPWRVEKRGKRNLADGIPILFVKLKDRATWMVCDSIAAPFVSRKYRFHGYATLRLPPLSRP